MNELLVLILAHRHEAGYADLERTAPLLAKSEDVP